MNPDGAAKLPGTLKLAGRGEDTALCSGSGELRSTEDDCRAEETSTSGLLSGMAPGRLSRSTS